MVGGELRMMERIMKVFNDKFRPNNIHILCKLKTLSQTREYVV